MSQATVQAGQIHAAADNATLATVAGIIILAGVLGGWAAYLTASPDASDANREQRKRLLRFLVVGCVASACVPLFLSLVQSDLLKAIFDAPRPAFQQDLVLLGLCLVAAFSARAFLESVSRRILRDLEDVKEQQQNLQQQVVQTAELVDEQNAQPVTPEAQARAQAEAETGLVGAASLPTLDDLELKALRALTRMSFRTATGVASDTGVPRSRIGEILDSLAGKGLVALTTSPNTNGPRWRITPAGVSALNKPSSGS